MHYAEDLKCVFIVWSKDTRAEKLTECFCANKHTILLYVYWHIFISTVKFTSISVFVTTKFRIYMYHV